MAKNPAVSMKSPLHLLCVVLGITAFLAYAGSKFISGKGIVLLTAVGGLGFLFTLVLLASRIKTPRGILRSIATILLAVLLGGYLLLFLLIFFFQDSIANRTAAFFQAQPLSEKALQLAALPGVEPLQLEAPDGITLRGWLVHNQAGSDPAPLLVYFEGSGSEVSRMIPYMRRLEGWSVALINYRGFGENEGVPGQESVLADALFIYDSLSRRADVNPGQIAAMGYSMGSGVAVYLAEQRSLAGTVLVSPYDSLTLVGLKKPPIYAPLAGIMQRYFDSIARAPHITTPLLCVVGESDTVIPAPVSLRLCGQWGGAQTVKTYPGEDHNLLLHDNHSWEDIADFLAGLR